MNLFPTHKQDEESFYAEVYGKLNITEKQFDDNIDLINEAITDCLEEYDSIDAKSICILIEGKIKKLVVGGLPTPSPNNVRIPTALYIRSRKMNLIEVLGKKDVILKQKIATCKKCGEEYFSPFDRLYIAVKGICYLCDEDEQLADNILKNI